MKAFYFLIAIAIAFLSSCSTVFNTRYDTLTVKSTKPAKVIFLDDTLHTVNNKLSITATRSDDPLRLRFITDSIDREISIPSNISLTYFCNIFSPYFSGLLIDLTNPRRFSYPAHLYVNLKQGEVGYSTVAALDTTRVKYFSILKFSPLKLVDLSNPAVEIALEKRISKKVSAQLMFSALLPYSYLNEDYSHQRGIRGDMEGKYYFTDESLQGFYGAFEVNLMKKKFNDINSYYKDGFDYSSNYNNNGYSYYEYNEAIIHEKYTIKKNTTSFNLKLGYQKIYNRFVLDAYAGFGVRYKNVKYTNYTQKPEKQAPKDPNIDYISNREGKYWAPSIPLNVKVGYLF